MRAKYDPIVVAAGLQRSRCRSCWRVAGIQPAGWCPSDPALSVSAVSEMPWSPAKTSRGGRVRGCYGEPAEPGSGDAGADVDVG